MLKNYENITFELTDQEKKILPQIIKGLNTKKGRENAITGDKICEKFTQYVIQEDYKPTNVTPKTDDLPF